MAFIFRIPRPADLDLAQKLEEAKQAASDSGYALRIAGDTTQGTIDGVVKGSYRISETAIVVNITDKPKIASESKIRDKVSGFFS